MAEGLQQAVAAYRSERLSGGLRSL
jgi:hypothetical protein